MQIAEMDATARLQYLLGMTVFENEAMKDEIVSLKKRISEVTEENTSLKKSSV